MLVGTANHANLANSQKGGGGTDFSIAAIMARGTSSREPSERSSSKFRVASKLPFNSKNYILKYSLCELLVVKKLFWENTKYYPQQIPWNQFNLIKTTIKRKRYGATSVALHFINYSTTLQQCVLNEQIEKWCHCPIATYYQFQINYPTYGANNSTCTRTGGNTGSIHWRSLTVTNPGK